MLHRLHLQVMDVEVLIKTNVNVELLFSAEDHVEFTWSRFISSTENTAHFSLSLFQYFIH